MQLWKRYFGPFVRIAGTDIDPPCEPAEKDQISVRIGSPDDAALLSSVIEEFGMPDIVIDDGSPPRSHINATFDFLFPKVPKNNAHSATPAPLSSAPQEFSTR